MSELELFHQPVLLKDVLDYLQVQKRACYIDATVGAGGHAVEILKQGGRLLGIDQDPLALKLAHRRFVALGFNERAYCLVQANFRQIKEIAQAKGFVPVAGILFDLGMSSFQLELSGRGFSFRRDEPLDMRMDPSLKVTAADLVNGLSPKELYDLFLSYGQEPHAKPIARAITRSRLDRPIRSTRDLVEVIRLVTSSGKSRARVFQALRIAVNDELESLRDSLPNALSLLMPAGIIVVISFHSLEDRIVKKFYRQEQDKGRLRILTRRPVVASPLEVTRNPRANAAKLRAAMRL